MSYKLNKRAQISETITWMVAFLIIFVIMILFLAATNYLSNSRSKSSMEFVNYSAGEYALSRDLSSFLNSGSGDWIVYDYLSSKGFDKSVFKEYLGIYFGKLSECYIFCYYSQKNEKIVSYWNDACGQPASSEWRGFTATNKPNDFCEALPSGTIYSTFGVQNNKVYLFKVVKNE